MQKHVLVAFMVVLAGCGTTVGVREFQTYSDAFEAVEEASDSVLNEIAAEERAKRIRALDGRGISDKLERKDISTFAPSADPPFVASMRFAVHSVADMNDILLAYAQGRALAVLKKDVEDLRNAGSGFSVIETASSAAKEMSKSILVLNEALGLLGGIGSREAFRDELAKSSAKINAVLDVLLKHSTTAFRTLTTSERRELLTNPSNAAAIRQEIATEREMLAEWLHLIELSQVALNKAVEAASSQPDRNSRLVEAAVLTGDLRARADRIKRLAAQN